MIKIFRYVLHLYKFKASMSLYKHTAIFRKAIFLFMYQID